MHSTIIILTFTAGRFVSRSTIIYDLVVVYSHIAAILYFCYSASSKCYYFAIPVVRLKAYRFSTLGAHSMFFLRIFLE